MENKVLNIDDVNCCANSLRKVIKQIKTKLKNNKHQYEYCEYLKKAMIKMQSAMLYAQELKQHCD